MGQFLGVSEIERMDASARADGLRGDGFRVRAVLRGRGAHPRQPGTGQRASPTRIGTKIATTMKIDKDRDKDRDNDSLPANTVCIHAA